jgi:ABC-type lipoprotein release transport system permease subunit
MNPLSSWTYYRQHKGRAGLLIGFVALVVAGLYLMMAIFWAISVEPIRSNRMFLSRFSVLMPSHGNEMDAAVMAQVRANPDVERVIPAIHSLGISLPEATGGGTNWFNLLGLREEDLFPVLDACGAVVKEGHPLEARTNGIMLSEQIARALGLQVGDVIHDKVSPKFYSSVVDPLEVVAILESEVRLGIVSMEYLSSHEFYNRMPTRFLVVAQKGRESAVDAFLRREIRTLRTNVATLETLNQELAHQYWTTYTLIVPVVLLVSLAAMLVVGAVNRIDLSRRLPEFGILNATGHSKQWLTRRSTSETAVVAAVGWLLGIGLSWLVLLILKLTLFEPRGHDLRVVTLPPVVLVLAVPVSVVVFRLLTVSRLFSCMDSVAIVERGELSLELPEQPSAKPQASRRTSSAKPLASSTFYRRHKARALVVTGSMALMIMAVVLVVFVFTATHDAGKASYAELARFDVVAPRIGATLDPGLATQMRAHPSVEKVIPTFRQTMLSLIIPPFGGMNIHPYALYTDDMAYVVDLFDLRLKEGHLPQPRTNEIAIPESVAANRNLKVGDVIGDPDRPAYPGAQSIRLPSPYVISGIFARPETDGEDHWLTLISLEYVESHEGYGPVSSLASQYLVVPAEGQKAAMNEWLLGEVESLTVAVRTYSQAAAAERQGVRTTLATIALLESVIAIMAAIALAVLNYLFMSQRRSEYGVLNALGHGRAWLVRRTMRETLLTTGAAWALSAVVCLGGLLYLGFGLFQPLGLRLNLLNLTPWTFTLPIPVAVLTVTWLSITRTLSRLDPVTIIERR